MFLVFTN